jgi:hypothetical protein
MSLLSLSRPYEWDPHPYGPCPAVQADYRVSSNGMAEIPDTAAHMCRAARRKGAGRGAICVLANGTFVARQSRIPLERYETVVDPRESA